MRIAADRHYLTDVLVGAAVGTAVGLAVPHLMHKEPAPPDLGPPPPPEAPQLVVGMRIRQQGSARAGLVLGAGLRHGGPCLTATWAW